MEKIIGLKIGFECQKCGELINIKTIAADVNTLKSGIRGPESCKCGAMRGFKIVSLEQIEFTEGGAV